MSISLVMIILLIFSLMGLFCLSAVNTAFRRLYRRDPKKQSDLFNRKRFFYRYISSPSYEDLYFANLLSQSALGFCYAIFSLLLVWSPRSASDTIDLSGSGMAPALEWPLAVIALFFLFVVLFLFGEFFPRMVGTRYPESIIKYFTPLVSCFLFLFFPLTFLFLKISHLFSPSLHLDSIYEPIQKTKQELIEIIEEANLNTQLDPHDKKLIESVMHFKDRIAREIMVPRVSIFSLPHDTTIEDAATLLYKEGYSRTPVYKDTLDNIIGVLMYKDVLTKYMEQAKQGDQSILKAPIESLVKNILYTPETKKISHLLQEFRKQQVHLAIIVDEYGGTEGIVTIEDILEEIVGEIADEYDEEEALFLSLPNDEWLIDARMGILDIEEQLGIEIPQEGDYDTIGGYVFHETGTIPKKGYIMRTPTFELEVVRSNDRRVEKLRIKPHPPAENSL